MPVELEDPVAAAALDGGVARAGEVALPGEAVDVPLGLGVLGGEAAHDALCVVARGVVDADDELAGDRQDGVDGAGDSPGLVLEEEKGGEVSCAIHGINMG